MNLSRLKTHHARRSPRVRARRTVFLVLALASLAGCHNTQPQAAPLPKAEVVVAQAANGVDSALYPGHIEARYANDLAFRVAGKLTLRLVRLGDVVHAGQVVAQLDAHDADLQLASARAALDAATSRLVFSDQQLRRDRAQATLNLISKVQLEQSQDNFSAAQAAQDQAASQWRQLQDNQRYQTLRADHDGVIVEEYADTGAVLSTGQPVYRLAWSGAQDVIIDVAANDIEHLRIGQLAEVQPTSFPALHLQARLREKAPQQDEQSGSFQVKLSLLPPNANLPLGLSASVLLQNSGPAQQRTVQVKIPASALFHQGEHPAVWVMRPGDQRLSLRPVTVSRYEEDSVLLSSGLAPGEHIVAAGAHTVYAGERVKPIPPLFSDAASEGATQ